MRSAARARRASAGPMPEDFDLGPVRARLARAAEPGLAQVPEGIGLLMAAQWQGSLLWWSFDPRGKVEKFVEASLRHFVSAVVTPERRTRGRRQ